MNNAYKQSFKIISDVILNTTAAVFLEVAPKGGKKIETFDVVEDPGSNAALNIKPRKIEGLKGFRKKLFFSLTPVSDLSQLTWDGRIRQNFAVTYTLENPILEETIMSDDYFVHFFPTEALTNFPRHIIFVIDVSGSMQGMTKITLLRLDYKVRLVKASLG